MTLTLTTVFLLIGGIALALTAIRYFIQKPLSVPVLFVQNFVGAFFIFSGFVKSVDPLGTSYKIQEYFVEFGMGFLEPYTLAFSVVTIVLEIVIGITLLLGYQKTITVWLLLLLIIFFTFLTGYTTFTGHVTDCGCFGDFLKIEPKQSFMKDIFLSVLILFLFIRKKYIEESFPTFISAGLTGVATIAFTLFCFRNFAWNEPVFDFRPYKVGNYLPDYMKGIPDKVEFSWVNKNKQTGEIKEFTNDEYMKAIGEPGFKDTWEYVDRKDKVIEKGVPAKIANFQILNEYEEDMSEDVLYNPDYQFLVIAYDLKKTDAASFQKLNPLAEGAEKDGFMFYAVSAASAKEKEAFRHENQTAFPFYSADGTFLKTIVRSNPGLLLLKNGTVVGKWHHDHFPTYEELKRDYLK